MKHFYKTIIILISLLGTFAIQAEPVKFKFTDLNGKTYTNKDFAGKWLIVNYWATWCPPCRYEIPELVAFHKKYKDVYMLGVAFEDIDDTKLKEFIGKYAISYPIVKAKPAASSPFGPIDSLPITFVISPRGNIAAAKSGRVTLKGLESGFFYVTQTYEE